VAFFATESRPKNYIFFAKIDEKSVNNNFNNFNDWLEKKKVEYKITNSNDISYNPFSLVSNAFAQDGPDSGNGSNQSSNSDDNHDNTMRSGSWSGFVKTQTGAGIPGADAHITTGCNAPAGRHMTTDGNGYFNTGVDTNLSCNCTPHTITANVPNMVCDKYTFQSVGNPVADINRDIICRPPPPPTPTPTPVPPILRCNQECPDDTFCAQTTGDTCSRCLPNPGGTGKTCQPPPPPIQCNAVCTDDAFCEKAVNGCTRCLPNATNPAQRTCQKTPVCGNLCITPADCNDAKNGCTSCLPDQSNPTKSICQTKPICGSSCSTAEYCLNAENGCTSCIEGAGGAKCGQCPTGMVYNPQTKSCACPNPNETNPHKVCDGEKCLDVGSCGISSCNGDKACFADEMCKCDGFDSVKLEYPSANPFMFEAFAKVEGTDMTKAGVDGMSFAMYESDKSNPNAASIIAQSPVYKPEIVSSTASKVRYKATWSLTPPQVKAGKLYRVQANIKCVPKKKSTLAELPTNQFQSRILGVKSANAQEPTPVPTPDYLQLKTLNFIKKVQGEQCHSMSFELSEGIGTGQ